MKGMVVVLFALLLVLVNSGAYSEDVDLRGVDASSVDGNEDGMIVAERADRWLFGLPEQTEPSTSETQTRPYRPRPAGHKMSGRRRGKKGRRGHNHKPCGKLCHGRHGRGRGNFKQIHILKKIKMLQMNFTEKIGFICAKMQSKNDSRMNAWARHPKFQQKIADKKACCEKEGNARTDCFVALKERFQDELCNRIGNNRTGAHDRKHRFMNQQWRIMKFDCCKVEGTARYTCFNDVREKKIQEILSRFNSSLKGEDRGGYRGNKRGHKQQGKQRQVKGRFAMCCEAGSRAGNAASDTDNDDSSCKMAAIRYVQSIRIRGHMICKKKFTACCISAKNQENGPRRGSRQGGMRRRIRPQTHRRLGMDAAGFKRIVGRRGQHGGRQYDRRG